MSFANFAQEPIPLAFKALKFHYPTFLSPNLEILFRNFSQMTFFIDLNYLKRAFHVIFRKFLIDFKLPTHLQKLQHSNLFNFAG